MNVKMAHIIVASVHYATTQMALINVSATLDILAMDLTVKVTLLSLNFLETHTVFCRYK